MPATPFRTSPALRDETSTETLPAGVAEHGFLYARDPIAHAIAVPVGDRGLRDFVVALGLERSPVLAAINESIAAEKRKLTANFKFIGGNEDFDVTSNQWGLGIGLEGYFNITQNLQFVLAGGVDYFFAATLSGHDTKYSPDGDDVNPRNDYTYDDADDAINQLSWEPRAIIGLSYWFGGQTGQN